MPALKSLQVAVIQTELVWQDAPANRLALQPLLQQASAADLIVLPEMFNSGFSMQCQQIAETMQGATVQWLREQASMLNAAICGSMAVRLDETVDGHAGVVNRLLFVTPDGMVQFYDKRHLFRMAQEHLHYQPGQQRVVVEFRGVRILLQVCYDLRFPVFSRYLGDYDAMIYVANWPANRQHIWSTLLAARAMENQAFVLGCNRVGQDGKGIDYSGNSVVLDYRGEVLAQTTAGQSAILTATLDLAALQQFRQQFPVALDADEFVLKV